MQCVDLLTSVLSETVDSLRLRSNRGLASVENDVLVGAVNGQDVDDYLLCDQRYLRRHGWSRGIGETQDRRRGLLDGVCGLARPLSRDLASLNCGVLQCELRRLVDLLGILLPRSDEGSELFPSLLIQKGGQLA